MTDNFSVKKVLVNENMTEKLVKKAEGGNENIKLFDFNPEIESNFGFLGTENITEAKSKEDKPYSKSKIISVLNKELVKPEPDKKAKAEIIKSVKSIDEDNFKYILTQYEKTPLAKSLLDLLQETKQLNIDEKKECLNHIIEKGKLSASKNNQLSADVLPNIDKIMENYNDSTKRLDKWRLTADVRKLSDRSDTLRTRVPVANGVIDKTYKQGNTGDCWLLAGIKALSLTEEGKKILDETVSYDENTKITTVKLKTGGKSYQITESELKGNNSFSNGDGDVRAVEIAIDRLMREMGLFGRADIKGNPTNAGLQLLTGKVNDTFIKDDKKAIDAALDKIAKDDKKNKKIAATTAILGNKDVSGVKAKIGTQDEPLYSAHAYTIAGADSRSVYLVNPHDSSQTISIDRETYLEYFNNLSLLEL